MRENHPGWVIWWSAVRRRGFQQGIILICEMRDFTKASPVGTPTAEPLGRFRKIAFQRMSARPKRKSFEKVTAVRRWQGNGTFRWILYAKSEEMH